MRKQIIVFAIFETLSILLLVLCRNNTVPLRDRLVSLLGLGWLLTKMRGAPENVVLKKTPQFKSRFKILSSCEVLLAIFLPWWLLIHDILQGDPSMVGCFLAPHLFVFQQQIALESLISREHHHLLFRFTVIANAYRGIVVSTGVLRWLDDSSPLIIRLVPVLIVLLWFASNAFIALDWYPCLQSTEKKPC